MTWKLGCKSSPSPKSSAVAFSCILVFCLTWPTREYGNAHTSLCTGIGGKECSKGGKSVSVNSERFTCSFPILPECGRQVSFGHIHVPAPACLCWAPALGGWDWWQLFVFAFLTLTQQDCRCWRYSDSAQNSFGLRNSAYFQAGFFLSLTFFFSFCYLRCFFSTTRVGRNWSSSQISPAVVICAGFIEITQHYLLFMWIVVWDHYKVKTYLNTSYIKNILPKMLINMHNNNVSAFSGASNFSCMLK